MTFDLPFAAYEPHGSAWGVSCSSAAATPQRTPAGPDFDLSGTSATFLLINAKSRVEIATSIERLINMLDELEGDPDLEDGAETGIGDRDGLYEDREPSLVVTPGKNLWHFQMGSPVFAAPVSYLLDGRQYVVIPSGSALFAFALPEARP